jgi:hypothetical protein
MKGHYSPYWILVLEVRAPRALVSALGEPQHSVISQPRYPADLHLLLRSQAACLQFIRQSRPLSDEGGVSTRESGACLCGVLLSSSLVLFLRRSSRSRRSLCLHSRPVRPCNFLRSSISNGRFGSRLLSSDNRRFAFSLFT